MRNIIPVILLLAIFGSSCMERSNEGKKITLVLPEYENGKQVQNTDSAFTILMVNDSTVYIFKGRKLNEGIQYSYKQLRPFLISKSSSPAFVVLIKPGEKSTHKSTVNILDEMAINNIKSYSLMDPSKQEQEMINSILNKKTTKP